MVDDSVGWPCLRFDNPKVRTEQLIPLSAKAAAAIRAQQDHVLERWPDGSPWLFPGIIDNPDGAKPYAHGSLSQPARPTGRRRIDVRDEAGQPVRVHAHQFRHTVGTRLINAGVPQHVIQKLLGHYAGDPVKREHQFPSGGFLVEAGEEPVEDLLAAHLALGGGVVALSLEGGAELDGGLTKKVHDSQIDSKWQSRSTGRAQ